MISYSARGFCVFFCTARVYTVIEWGCVGIEREVDCTWEWGDEGTREGG